MTTIIVTHEDNNIDEFNFEQDQSVITLGRRPGNDVCISDLSISGNHARLSFSNNISILEDLGSTNGTYVNGQIIQSASVKPGDEIILGKVELRFRSNSSRNEQHATQARTHVERTGTQSEFADDPIADRNPVHERYDNPAMSTPSHSASRADSGPSTQDSVQTTAFGRAIPPQSAPSESSFGLENTPSEPRIAQNHPLDGVEPNAMSQVRQQSEQMHELDGPSASSSKGAVIEIKNGAKSGQILPIDKPVTTLGRPGIQIAAIMRKPDGYFLMHIESSKESNPPTLNRDAIGDEPVLLHSGDALTVAGIDVEFMLS